MEFNAPPAAVPAGKQSRSKYRKVEHGNSTGGNLMYDRRVMRGNTYGGIVVPPTGTGNIGSGRRRKKKFISPDADSIFNIRPEVERREGIDLSQYLISKEDAKGGDTRVEVHVDTQTDVFEELAPPAPYIPKKTGVDVSTQIETSDNLFKFDLEVAPILEVLVGKTLEQSLLEVQEEEELLDLKTRKTALVKEKVKEDERIKNMERDEQKKWEEKETHRKAEENRVEREKDLEQKVWASYMSKTLVEEPFVDGVFDRLERNGVFRDPTRRSVEDVFMPWVLEAVGGQMDRVAMSRRLLDHALQRTLTDAGNGETTAQRREREQNEFANTSEAKFQDAEARKGIIRIMVEGLGVGEIGPIPVQAGDTIAQVEAKVQAWIAENVGDLDFTPPESGILGLAFEGRELDSSTSLLDEHIPDMAKFQVPKTEEEVEEGADAENAADAEAEAPVEGEEE